MSGQNSFPPWVPSEIAEGYALKGLRCLFDWQAAVLARTGGNLVFCAPTSAGKSLVAELLGLRVARQGKRVLFVLPYIAVAKEKLNFLQKLWRRVDIQVAGYIGPNSAPSREWTAAVCTLEKANSLISHAISDGRLDEYGMIVIDELHMVLDNSRGATLEALASKIGYYNGKQTTSRRIDIVGMSATLPNVDRIAQWLNAEVYVTDFRPVELGHCYSTDGVLYSVENRKEIRRLNNRFRYPGDSDSTVGFCIESILARNPTLVFCSSKQEVEKVALEVARIMDQELKLEENEGFLSQEKLLELKALLEKSCTQLDPTLAKTLPRGVAYHHAGLTSEERECVEKAFREGTIFALVATSTLSSGVNLPAARVVIKAQTRGPACLNSTTYSQMAGRAGRMGFAERGESIVAIKPADLETALRLIRTPPTTGNGRRDASKVILESVCSGLTPNVSSVVSLASQLLHEPQHAPEQTIAELASTALISRCDDEEEEEKEDCEEIPLTATQLGRAALASSLPPDAALFVFADLKNACRALAIDTELHMMYLVTPINCSVWQGCDWNHLHNIFIRMDSDQKRIAKMVGANENFILARIQGRFIRPDDRQLQLHLRFFSALSLFNVICEVPLVEVAAKFRICRGMLQALQQQSATYAAMIVAFCNRLGWQYLRSLVEGFASRLAFGVRAELTELIRVDGIDGSRARVFHDHGITSLAQLAQSSVQDVATVLSLAVPFASENSDGNRQEWLFGEERMTLQEAAKTMISRAGEGVREIMRNLGIEVDVPAVLSQKKAALPSHRAVLRCISQSVERRRKSSTASISSEPEIDAEMCRSPLFEIGNREKAGVRGTPPQHNRSYSSSTPVGQKRPPRVSFPCSQIAEDSAMELFSSSIMELSLDENDDAPIEDAEKQEDGEQYDEEVQDLETSLLKAGASFVEDSFDQPVEFVRRGNTQKPRTAVHDSFDEPLSQLFLPKTQIPKRRERLSMTSTKSRAGDSVVDMSADLFDSFEKSPSTSSSNKRSRSSIECWSPTVSSPLCKSGRRSDKPSHLPQFHIEDICRSESSWNAFVTKSSQWEEVAMCIVQREDEVTAVAFCHKDEMPVFMPLSDDDYAGSGSEEVNYPSATPCQNISIRERRAHVERILGRAGVLFFDALSQCKSLRDSLEIEVVRPVCIEYLSFLGHYRTGEVPLSIGQLASRFDWPFNVQQLLRMSPRINTSVQAFICSRIFDRLHAQAVSQSSKGAVQLEISSIRTVTHISSVGFPFSHRLCTEMVVKIRGKIDALEEECHQLAGKFFNLESAPSVSEVLFSRLKIPHPGGIVAGKRHLSANKLILAQIVDLHPIVPKIIQFRQLKHAISQCLLPLLEHVSSDDVIRTSFDIATATGRILSKNPSVQTVPKGQIVDNFAVRSLFSSKEGRVLIAADYCQLELRVLAHLSADPALLKQLSREDRDFFHELSQKWGFPRDSVKQLCYGLIYGMGVKALADATKLAVLEAQRLQDSFFDAFPKVKTYISTTRERAETVGFVTTFLGRRRVACTKGRQEDRSRDHRQSVNFTIQGTASEIFKKAITSIHARLGDLDADIVMIVHDEIIVDCQESIQSTVAGILRQETENVFPSLRVPLQVKVAIGSNWAELK